MKKPMKLTKCAVSRTRDTSNLYLIKVFIFLLCLFLGGVAMAQESNSEKQSETKEKTELEKKVEIAQQKQQLAEAKKAEAEALRAVAEAKLPVTETKGLEGTVTVSEGAGYYAEILAYEAVEDAADEIAKRINENFSTGPLIILGQVDLAEEAALWNLLKIKIKNVIEALDISIDMFPKGGEGYGLKEYESPYLISAAAPAILGAAADIVSFFKTDRTITAKAITINEQALISAAANSIKVVNPDLKIILPELDLTGEGELYSGIKELMAKRSQLIKIKEVLNRRFGEEIAKHSERLTRLEARKIILNKKIDKAIENSQDTTKLLKELEQIEVDIGNISAYDRHRTKVITRLDKEITAADEVITALTEKPADKLSPLERVAAIEKIKKEPEAKLLYLLTVSQGGEIETSKTIFTQGRVSYLGGAVICYILTSTEGEYLSSGNIQKIRTATFKRSKSIGSMRTDRRKPLI